MSDPAVTAYLTKLLCVHGGRLERNRLSDLLSLPEEQIEQILQDEPLRFPRSSELVLARTPLRICTRYLRPGDQEDEQGCPRLHLCRHYLRGQCPPDRRPRCRFSHDVESEHNRAVLRANELSGLNEHEIKVLLFQNDNQLLPEKCQQYKQDSCDQGEDCTRLHVCSFFTQDGCNRRSCRRSHNLLNSKLLLTCSWLNRETIQNFQMLCVLKSIERQQAPRQGSQNEEPWGARGMSRGRGRGRPGYNRRSGSQDLLDSRRRDRSSEGSHPRWRSSSRPPSQSRMGQRSGDEDYNDSDGSSDHGRYPTRLDNLMDDWFTPSAAQSGKARVRSVGVTPIEGIRSALPNKGHAMSSRADKPLKFTPLHQPEPIKSRLTSEFSTTSYNTLKADYDSSNSVGATPVPLLKSYPHVPYAGEAQGRPEVPLRIEQSVSYPTSYTRSSRPTLTTLNSVTSLTSPQPSTISSTSSSSREYPTIPPKPINALTSSLFNRQVHLSTGGSSSAETRVSPSLTASSNSEITSTKRPSTPNQKTDMDLGKGLGSSMARLSIAPSTPSKAALYTTTEMSSIAQPKPATSGHMGASSSSFNAFVEADTPSRKLQANVKPIIKTDTTGGPQYSQTDEDFESFCQSLKATNFTATKPQPPTTIPSVSPGKSSLKKTPEICLAHIWKHCSLEDKCPNMHYDLPYCWQVFNGRAWDDLPKMEDIEKAFSDPKIDRYQLLIDFQAMKSGSQPVRRLTTPSSVTQPPEYVLTTEWCWYWKNESGTWTEYGQLNTENMSAKIQSSDLETIYLSDPSGTIPFTAGNQTYIIDCREMKQRNLFFRTEREVRRRPKFLDFQNVKMLKGSTKSSTDSVKQMQSDPGIKNRIDPPHSKWEVVPENRYMKFILLHDSSEFTSIVAMFSKTVSNHTVKKIWRVENSNLWMLYNRQKDQMKKKNLANTVDERQLFHGTNPADIDVICSRNFDQNICGTNGIEYGLGSYFARDASYSHKYSIPTSAGRRTMFLAHVLVGDFTEGNPALIHPPQKYGSSQRYDSCVDNKNNPSIFVVFEKDQVYPMYILEYEERKTPCHVN
ncbi:zinc finger CCCH-type antiviral protein 1-like [Aquarana catesbeiana]